MILSKTVMVHLNANNIKHYKEKGYNLDIYYYIGKGGYICFHLGPPLEVKTEDLTPSSRAMVLMGCDVCGKERWVEYHNREEVCYDCYRQIEEYRKKMSEVKTGIKHTSEAIEKMKEYYYTIRYPNKETTITEEKKLKNKLRNRNRYEYDKWKRFIFKKYDNACQKCGTTNERMNTHHIESYSQNKDLQTDINNGIILCEKCHIEFHHIYGKYSNRKQLNDYLNKDNKNNE